jgi:hypothetical protein
MKRAFSCFVLCFVWLAGTPLAAQEEFIEPPSQRLTSVSFYQLTGGIVLLQARLDSFPDTLLHTDTGSSVFPFDSRWIISAEAHPTDRTIRVLQVSE